MGITAKRAFTASVFVMILATACDRTDVVVAPARASTPPPSLPTTPIPSSSPTGLPAVFRGSIAPIPPDLAAQMRGTTWHAGCPVPIDRLRLLTLRYWGMDGVVHEGPMVVNAAVVKGVVSVFGHLFRARFPLVRMALATEFHPNADPNTTSSVTASFNCRPVVTPAGPGTTFSMHAYGLAIDINPLQNPFVAADGTTRNRYARPYVDRSQHLPGMIHEGDVVVRAFARIGWGWGGRWSNGQDYMHFSSNGR